MKFKIYRSSDYLEQKAPPCRNAYKDEETGFWCVDINSLEDLARMQYHLGEDLILTGMTVIGDGDPTIEIYDDWRE